jgi:uncharacterized protein YlxP (DUF503 family)
MIVGTARIELHIPDAGSLKEKRAVVRSLRERLVNRLKVSAAEVDHLDLWQRAVIGVAVVSGDRRTVDQIMSKVINLCESDRRALVIDISVEIL